MSWDSGYVSEIGYTYGYYRELNPAFLRLACLSAGVAPPPSDSLNYLELGFGQGVSVNIHAAAFAGEFWGIDFSPTQAAHARSLAEASQSGAVLGDDSFVDFAARPDLPEFDVIALHGIWSWVSDENRRAIVDIIRRRLRVGGIVYLSYNCWPGWTPVIPLRHLMVLHAELAGSGAGITSKIDGAISFVEKVVASGAFHFKLNSGAADRLKAIAGQDRHYVAHEYFNRDWAVMPFSEVARWLDDAKLSFVAPATLIDHIDAINLLPEWRTFLAGIPNPVLGQTVRDYLVNKQFRRDIFIKGPRTLSAFDRAEALRAQAFVLLSRAEDVPMKVTASAGEVALNEQICRPLIEVLAQDGYSPKTLAVLADHAKLKAVAFDGLVTALVLLTGAGHVHPAQPVTKQSRERCKALNSFLYQRARAGADIPTLASPVTGSGVTADRFQQLFLLAQQQGRKTARDQAAFAWEVLSAQGQCLVKDGQALRTAEENIAELVQHVAKFADTRLPLLKALGLVEGAEGEPAAPWA